MVKPTIQRRAADRRIRQKLLQPLLAAVRMKAIIPWLLARVERVLAKVAALKAKGQGSRTRTGAALEPDRVRVAAPVQDLFRASRFKVAKIPRAPRRTTAQDSQWSLKLHMA